MCYWQQAFATRLWIGWKADGGQEAQPRGTRHGMHVKGRQKRDDKKGTTKKVTCWKQGTAEMSCMVESSGLCNCSVHMYVHMYALVHTDAKQQQVQNNAPVHLDIQVGCIASLMGGDQSLQAVGTEPAWKLQ